MLKKSSFNQYCEIKMVSIGTHFFYVFEHEIKGTDKKNEKKKKNKKEKQIISCKRFKKKQHTFNIFCIVEYNHIPSYSLNRF